jgi:cytosine/adenosine deaminase-related metal-dependent hydrolase
LFIQNRLPDLQLFSLQEFRNYICLGTDSLASNTNLSILEEMKMIQQHAPDISLETLLLWASLNGAQALGFDQILGSFEKGKKPGINLVTGIDFENLRFTGESEVKVIV